MPSADAVPSTETMSSAAEAQNLRWDIDRLRLITGELTRTCRLLRQAILGLCGVVAIFCGVVVWRTSPPADRPNPIPAQPAAATESLAPPVARVIEPTAAAQGQPKGEGSSVIWGQLNIVSNPRDAMVSIDRQRVGRTPLSSVPARPGSRTIWIDREGYQRWTTTIEVSPDGVRTIDATLVSRGSARSRQRR
jgi:hypothetical protein